MTLPVMHFPFTAVCGQDSFKLALVLAAINPAIGGVVISGPRGSAKSTLARGMAALLPAQCEGNSQSGNQGCAAKESVAANFVTLPLSASEEMLVGTLDLARVLNQKEVQFSPGLLSKAHGGVLYVDEVNLLPDNLTDLLLDVSTSGVNHIERDGISHSHAAEFVLVGTMNPDEGELRPQLHDRFGFSVDLTHQYTPAERVEIVKRREAFDQSPATFLAAFEAEQTALLNQIKNARNTLSDVTIADELRLEIAQRCAQAQVDGLRADIVWLRAAMAHAALHQRGQVSLDDLNAVELLVLAHRRKVPADSGGSHSGQNHNESDDAGMQPRMPEQPSKRPHQGFSRPDDSHRQNNAGAENTSESQSDDSTNEQSGNQGSGEWGAMPPKQQKMIQGLELGLKGCLLKRVPNPRAQGASTKNTSHARDLGPASRRPDWFKTLLASMPEWPPASFSFKKQRVKTETMHLILLDTSASTLKDKSAAYAKAAVLEISEHAYLNREPITLFGFGNSKVQNLLSRIRAPKELSAWLDQLGAAGGTPMRDVFVEAQSYIQQCQKKQPDLRVSVYVLSDGRSSSSLEGIHLNGQVTWIDTERSQIKRGRGRQFADQLNATYLALAGA